MLCLMARVTQPDNVKRAVVSSVVSFNPFDALAAMLAVLWPLDLSTPNG